jgi:hypothetical protein
MNNNTRLRVRVPKALYESIQAQLAKKQLREEKTPPAQAGDDSSAIDDKFMKTLSPAIKLANSKITSQKDFADFVLKFAKEVLSNEQFAGTTGENSNYKNAIKYLSSVAGKMQSSETPKAQ